jgi:hypothetical protein
MIFLKKITLSFFWGSILFAYQNVDLNGYKHFLKMFTDESIINHLDTKIKDISRYAYSTLDTLYNSFLLSLFVVKNDIEGDLVECGVAAGAQIAAFDLGLKYGKSTRRIHLFDSFEGIPLAGPKDTQQPGIGNISHDVNVGSEELLKTSGVSAHTLKGVEYNLFHLGVNIENLVFHKGWFQHVLPKVKDQIEKISILRLDGDLYESTLVCLENLYPKVVSGGFVIIDDYYSLEGCQRAVHEYFDKHNLNPKIIRVEGGLNVVYWQVQ